MNPSFGVSSTIRAALRAKVDLDVGDWATFDIADWNQDGSMDLVVGALDGKVCVCLNRRATGEPDLAAPAVVQEGGGDLLVSSGRSSVDVCDFNQDGRKDLVLGNTDAQVIFYPNKGTNAAPAFDSHELLVAVAGGSRSRPCVADFNADGVPDVLLGNVDGLVRYYLGALADDSGIIGNTTVFPSISTVTNRRAVSFVMSEDGSIESITIYHQGGTGNAILAVYGNAAGQPGNRLGVTDSTSDQQDRGLADDPVGEPANVWPARRSGWPGLREDPATPMDSRTPTRAISTATWSDAMPASFGASNSYNGRYSIYANYSPTRVDKTLGNTTVFPNISTVTNRRAVSFVMSEDGSIESITIYHQGGTGNAILAVYGNAAGQPGAGWE